jgi:hypothetical protein
MGRGGGGHPAFFGDDIGEPGFDIARQALASPQR